MNEELLQFIWRFGHFDNKELRTTDGDVLQILHPGIHNSNQGPDFLNARIRIGKTLWAGHVELHVRASGWQDHKHSSDPHYDNVVLHVVWEEDKKLNLPFPTIELKGRISLFLLKKYQGIINNDRDIPCSSEIRQVDPIIISHWKQRMAAERLELKAEQIMTRTGKGGIHWEDLFRRMLTRNFGLLQNADAFEMIADSISFEVWQKLRGDRKQLEAVLFGQAGLLDMDMPDEYHAALKNEYLFLKNKFRLQRIKCELQFFRMRPPGFPTIRLSQLAGFFTGNENLFGKFREMQTIREAREKLDVQAGEYWTSHFTFGEKSNPSVKNIGSQMINSILLNAVTPLLFSYANYHRDTTLKERMLLWMDELPPERNAITRLFEDLGVSNENASDSQGLIQMMKHYCTERRCLHCAIGNRIINPTAAVADALRKS